jgi:DNA-binding LytR/AlgR family response regulator
MNYYNAYAINLRNQPPPQQIPYQSHKSDTMPDGEIPSESAPTGTIITLETSRGIRLISTSTIISCHAQRKNTVVFVCAEDGTVTEIIALHLLKDIETLCATSPVFVRCHNSSLVNLEYCTGWHNKGCCIEAEMRYGKDITVAKSAKKLFLSAFTSLYPSPKSVAKSRNKRLD